MFDVFGLKDEKIEKVRKKYGKTAGDCWKYSNVSLRTAILCALISLIIIVIYIPTTYLNDYAPSPTYWLLLLAVMVAGIAVLAYTIILIILSVLTKDYGWTVAIIILGILAAWIYKYFKGGEL